MLEQTAAMPAPIARPRLSGLFRQKPARPGALYGLPGGDSAVISLVTGAVLVGLWFLVTELHLVKPLFLPSPVAVWHKFVTALTQGVARPSSSTPAPACSACSPPSPSRR